MNGLKDWEPDDEKRYIEENVESIFIWSANAQYNQSVTSIIKKK